MQEQETMAFEVNEHRSQQREAIVYKVIRHAMAALSARGLRYLSLLFAAGLFFWAAYEPDTNRIIVAALFSALVFLPVLFRKGESDAGEQ